MAISLAARIEDVLQISHNSYYRLILVVGAPRTGKTVALLELALRHNWPRVNVNLQLSERLLDLTQRQRVVRIAGILDDTIRAESSEVVLLDNIELLFAIELAQDPLRLLQSVSRNRTIIAAWSGTFDGGFLTYATPGHPEARRHPTPQAVIVNTSDGDLFDMGSPGGDMT